MASFQKKSAVIPAPVWGISRNKGREVGSVIYYAEGRVKGLFHINQFRVTLRLRQSTSVLAHGPAAGKCLQFILESERRAEKADAAKRLFCTTPKYSLEMLAFDKRGQRLNLLVTGFCIHETRLNTNHHLAIEIVEFAKSQIENTDWEMSQMFSDTTGSRLLLMSALLSAYFYGVTGRHR